MSAPGMISIQIRSAQQLIDEAVDQLAAARKLVADLEADCLKMSNSPKLGVPGVFALYEVTKALETIDHRILDALEKLGN